MLNYFWPQAEVRLNGSNQCGPLYTEQQFERRFRMSRSMFNTVFEATTADSAYLRAGLTAHCAGNLGISRF